MESVESDPVATEEARAIVPTETSDDFTEASGVSVVASEATRSGRTCLPCRPPGRPKGWEKDWTKRPWGVLPESTDQRADAAWALANYSACVKTFPDKPTVIEWGRAKTAPPSHWAEAMLEAAALNRQKFLFEMVPGALKLRGEEDDPGLLKEERMALVEMERVLAGLLEDGQ